MNLSKTQQELYDAMKSGVTVYYMRYMGSFNPNAYYFRGDSNKRVTSAANALIKKGLAKKEGGYNDHRLKLIEEKSQ